MIARIVRRFWLVVLAAALGAAWLSVHLVGARIGVLAAALLGVFAIACLHPLVIAVNFTLSRVFGDPVPTPLRLSLWQALATYDAEIDASMRGLWFATPFLDRRRARRPVDGVVSRPMPILFVHGYFCNRAVWLSFMRDAAARGYLCEAMTIADPFASIDRHAGEVDRAIDALLAEARASGLSGERVVVVAHSMGGLVARAARPAIGAARGAHGLTLGTPPHGTFTARFGSYASVVQMRRRSAWLADLEARERSNAEALPRHDYTTLHSVHDQIVYPQRTGQLEGTQGIVVGGCGHVALLYDRRVRSVVFERLAVVEGRLQAAGGFAS